jgi:hypothetical protein
MLALHCTENGDGQFTRRLHALRTEVEGDSPEFTSNRIGGRVVALPQPRGLEARRIASGIAGELLPEPAGQSRKPGPSHDAIGDLARSLKSLIGKDFLYKRSGVKVSVL